jgi:hypothetical protein
MRVKQARWSEGKEWFPPLVPDQKSQVVLLFGARAALGEPARLQELKKTYPNAILFGCSTAGEICDTKVFDDTLIITAVEFERTRVVPAYAPINDADDSRVVGQTIGRKFNKEGLRHVFILSDGLGVNGSELVKGLSEALPGGVSITGGLSGDGANFQETHVLSADGSPVKGMVAALGLYGDKLRVGYASLGGWDPFGPERIITRSQGNVLYELDGTSALALYKRYLGDHAKDLPSAGLLFPLSLREREGETPVVRTILGIDEKEGSITFAGNMTQGTVARFMKANFDRLIDGASGAAKASALDGGGPELAILISCIGRKLILKQRIEEEVESVRAVLGPRPSLAGFYSYGEISPFTPGAKCELHNQTMTITTFLEAL